MNLSTKAKANLAFLLALIALGIIGSFSFLASRNLKEKAQWVSHTHEVRETLRSHSIRDPLTGLFNRRYLEESRR